MNTYCTVCQEETECKHLSLYTIGSEGTWICNSCELATVEFLRALIRIAGKSRKIGYANAKAVAKSKANQ